MKKGTPKEDGNAKSAAAPKNSGYKALRSMRRKAYYNARPAQTLLSKQRRLGRQIRRFPEDRQAQLQFVERYGEKALVGHLASPVKRAKRRMKRKRHAVVV